MTTEDSSPVPDYLQKLRLDGRSYVVLGAGLGMGRQTCHALSQAGAAHVLCVDIDEHRAREVAAEIPGGLSWHGDVTKRSEVVRLAADASQQLGRINGFVDIIGMAQWKSILEIDDEIWDWEFDICLRHAYLCSQELGKLMVASGGGTMVFISSISGLSAAPMHAAYGAAKAALMAWVQSLAVELGPHQIRANAIAPGTILTPRLDAIFTDEQRTANNEVVPIGRVGQPPDIASAALFLSSDLSAFVNGRTLVVDGGVDAKFPYNTL
ncbi:MAG: SDR family oxidoreductase [Ilumatobacteraceae bacterium]|nr:SDR family oxidoreductase [Ilumatobacteraceae bacterium]